MKLFGMRDCAGWYLGFMDEMREFATQPTDVKTLKEIKSRLDNAKMQVDELIRLQQHEENKSVSSWNADSMMRHELPCATYRLLTHKERKKLKSKLKKSQLKAVDIRSMGDQFSPFNQSSIEIKLGDQVVFSRVVPTLGSPYGVGTTDRQANLDVQAILQSALASF